MKVTVAQQQAAVDFMITSMSRCNRDVYGNPTEGKVDVTVEFPANVHAVRAFLMVMGVEFEE